MEVSIVAVLREHGHGGIWSVGHEADVVRRLLLLGRLLLGGEEVRGIHGHLGELGYVLLLTQHVGGRTDVHNESRGVGERGMRTKKAGNKRARGEHGASAGRARRNGGGNGRGWGTERAVAAGGGRDADRLGGRGRRSAGDI